MAREDDKEYYGSKPVKGFDWVTASQKGIQQIEGVIAKRQKERDENVKFEQETDTALLREEKGKSKDLNEIVAQGAFTSKKKAYELTRQLKMNKLSSQEYRIAMNNLQDGWNNFNDISKGFNEKLQLFAQRGQQDIASIMESAAAKEFSLMADLKGKDIKISNTGKVLWGDGKTYSSMTDLNNTPQQLHDQVKLSNVVNSKAEFIGTFKEAIRANNLYSTKGTAAMESLTDVQGVSEYTKIVKGVQDEILAGPNMMNNAASVLGDNMLGPNGETFYTYKDSDLVDAKDPSQGFRPGLGLDGVDLQVDLNGKLIYGIRTIKNAEDQLTADVTDTQMETARVGIENTFRAQIGIEQQPLPYNNPNSSFYANKEKKAKIASATEDYVGAMMAATRTDLASLAASVPTATRVLKNVRGDSDTIVYDVYNPKTQKTTYNVVEDLSVYGEDKWEERALAVFGVMTGLTGTALKNRWSTAQDNLKPAQKAQIKKAMENPGAFTQITDANYKPLDNLESITLLEEGRTFGKSKMAVSGFSVGENTIGTYVNELSSAIGNTTGSGHAAFKSDGKLKDNFKTDLTNFFKQVVRTGGRVPIPSTISINKFGNGVQATIKVKGVQTPYKITLTSDPDANTQILNEILLQIIDDQY